MSTEKTAIPEGYMQNAAGHLVPVTQVTDLDIMKDELVKDIIGQTRNLQDTMREFKHMVLSDVGAFIDLAVNEYDVKLGGVKGNVSLVSFDGNYKIMFAVQECLAFDEKIYAAKAIIDECLHKWTENADANVKSLIDHAFSADKAGNIRTSAVLGLFKLKITDARWMKAMEALKDSLTVASSKSYIRFYERAGEQNKWQQISLDIAGL